MRDLVKERRDFTASLNEEPAPVGFSDEIGQIGSIDGEYTEKEQYLEQLSLGDDCMGKQFEKGLFDDWFDEECSLPCLVEDEEEFEKGISRGQEELQQALYNSYKQEPYMNYTLESDIFEHSIPKINYEIIELLLPGDKINEKESAIVSIKNQDESDTMKESTGCVDSGLMKVNDLNQKWLSLIDSKAILEKESRTSEDICLTHKRTDDGPKKNQSFKIYINIIEYDKYRNMKKAIHQSEAVLNEKITERTMCTCKRIRCLKLYCDCFRKGVFCGYLCKCIGCENVESNKEKIDSLVCDVALNKRKEESCCNCKMSFCEKSYCPCLKLGKGCSSNCQCFNCKNPLNTPLSFLKR